MAGKTLTEIRRTVDHDTCSDVRSLLDLLRRIAENNPQALQDAVRAKYTFGKTPITDARVEQMVEYTIDKIGYVREQFDNR